MTIGSLNTNQAKVFSGRVGLRTLWYSVSGNMGNFTRGLSGDRGEFGYPKS